MHEQLTLERALADSSFLMPMQDEEGGPGRFAAWGCGDYRHLSGGGGAVAWNGEAFSMSLGAGRATRIQYAGGAVRIPVEGLVRLPRGRSGAERPAVPTTCG